MKSCWIEGAHPAERGSLSLGAMHLDSTIRVAGPRVFMAPLYGGSTVVARSADELEDFKSLRELPMKYGVTYASLGAQTITDTTPPSAILGVMSSYPLELNEARAEYHARWEAVETFKALELAAMTNEQAQQIIQNLGAIEGWRERPDWSGLIEQQEIFQRGQKS